MPFFIVALPLPSQIRRSLSRLCHGLEHVEWTEEWDLCLQLQLIEIKNPGLLIEIQEYLANIVLPPFVVTLQGVHADKGKQGRGTLWAGVLENSELLRLRQELRRHLKAPDFIATETPPRIILGRFQTLSTEHLATYLEAHSSFTLLPCEISAFALLESRQTPKRIIVTPVQKFSLRA